MAKFIIPILSLRCSKYPTAFLLGSVCNISIFKIDHCDNVFEDPKLLDESVMLSYVHPNNVRVSISNVCFGQIVIVRMETISIEI